MWLSRYLFALTVVALCTLAEAQQLRKISRVGFLLPGGSSEPSRKTAFQQSLRDLGYIEGENIRL
jgi:hypothetical protein